jgi:hypothetical protein
MHPQTVEMRNVALGSLGERLSALRLCAPSMLATVRCSLAQHGQLSALTVFAAGDGLEIVDGFKRMRAARALGWPTLLVRVDEVDSIEAKLRLYALHDRGGLCELEEGWLVRALYRDDGLSLPRGTGREWSITRIVSEATPDNGCLVYSASRLDQGELGRSCRLCSTARRIFREIDSAATSVLSECVTCLATSR